MGAPLLQHASVGRWEHQKQSNERPEDPITNYILKPTMAIMSSAFIRVCSICMLVASYPSSFHVYSFQFQQQPSASSQSSQQRSRIKTTQLSSSSSSSIVQPNESSTIGTVGSGYLPILIAKLAAHRRHGKSWIICE